MMKSNVKSNGNNHNNPVLNPICDPDAVHAEVYRVSTGSYDHVFRLCCTALMEYWERFRTDYSHSYSFPSSFFQDVSERGSSFKWMDLLIMLSMAVNITVVRIAFTNLIALPIARKLETPSDLVHRVPEILFKITFYSCTTAFIFHMLSVASENYYHRYWNDPLLMIQLYRPSSPIPPDIYVLYMIETGFYVHGIYGCVYMDSHRKDTALMLCHHGVTITLLLFSFCSRYHVFGLLVLACHDACDIFLELWKFNCTMRHRANGRYYTVHDRLATISFAMFMTSWVVFRLYWFPLKVMYAVIYGTVALGLVPKMPFYPIFASMILSLFALNMYWFSLMVQGLLNLALGRLKEVDDVREERSPSSESPSTPSAVKYDKME